MRRQSPGSRSALGSGEFCRTKSSACSREGMPSPRVAADEVGLQQHALGQRKKTRLAATLLLKAALQADGDAMCAACHAASSAQPSVQLQAGPLSACMSRNTEASGSMHHAAAAMPSGASKTSSQHACSHGTISAAPAAVCLLEKLHGSFWGAQQDLHHRLLQGCVLGLRDTSGSSSACMSRATSGGLVQHTSFQGQ